jgi:hypothetical protein
MAGGMPVRGRWFADADKLLKGDVGRPIQIDDESARQGKQRQNLESQSSRNSHPIDAAIVRVMGST